MDRVVFQIWSDRDRARAIEMIRYAERNSVFDLSPPTRTIAQNSRLHALLADTRRLGKAKGYDFTLDQWKALFLHAAGFTMEFLPALDGGSFVPYRQSTAAMGKAQVGELMDFIEAWTVQNLEPPGWAEQGGNIHEFPARSRFALMDKSAERPSENPETKD